MEWSKDHTLTFDRSDNIFHFIDIGFTGVTYSDFVVVLNETEAYGDIVRVLEGVYSDKEGMRRRVAALQKVRKYFLYNFSGSEPDAVTLVLMGILNRITYHS